MILSPKWSDNGWAFLTTTEYLSLKPRHASKIDKVELSDDDWPSERGPVEEKKVQFANQDLPHNVGEVKFEMVCCF